MTRSLRHLFSGALLALTVFSASVACAEGLDVNGDGMIRIVLLSKPLQNGGIEAATICSDLESMIKAAKPGRPVRVTHEPVSQSRTLMGWWYHPDAQGARAQLFAGQYDLLLLAEHDEVVRDYPEFFFEGVRAVSREATAKGLRSVLVQMTKPGNSFRDKRVQTVADTVYRVGDGCGLEVIPAAFGWHEALARNRMTGDSPVKARACAYLTAAAIYCQLSGTRVPKGALEAFWTTKKTTEVLALSAREAIENERVKRHYEGLFSGVVRIEPRIKKRLKVYVPNTAEEDPLRQNVQYVLDASFQDWFWKTPADWYRDGFDRYSAAFDLVYGDLQQMGQYLDETLYSSVSAAPANMPKPCAAVFCRTPEGDSSGMATLRNLEATLLEGYDYAKSKNLVFIPYPLAWARARQADPKLVQAAGPGQVNDWLNYMLATMVYTLVTDRFQPPPEKPKPQHANADHPRGYHEACARIGYETVMQLATLTAPQNAVLLRSETYRIDSENPGFASIRLLERPSKEVRVFCATDIPGVAALSREALVFTPDTFDIEQTVRILPATNTPTLFFHFMASAQSEDKVIDGANDLRPYLLNFNEAEPAELLPARLSFSPATGFQTLIRPNLRPSDIVCASVVQHGQVTEEIYFSPDHFEGSPLRLYPTAADYQNGALAVSVRTTSSDRRFNNKQFSFTFQVSHNGTAVPQVRIIAPASGSVIEGPAFVSARAEADAARGIKAVSLYLGHKRLGRSTTPVCSVAVEQGPPQSRLGGGVYTLWSEAVTTNGLVVASEPVTFRVRAADAPAGVSAE